MKKKNMCIYICFMLIISVFMTTELLAEKTSCFYNGNTLYVGGTGPGNYSKIQDAIDNAYDGDTVYVYDDSSPYYENINIYRHINLIGEDKNTTVINGNGSGNVVTIKSFVNISCFTIGDGINGIYIRGICNKIINNIIQYNLDYGIFLDRYCNGNICTKNVIFNNYIGIYLDFDGYENTISNNIIFRNYYHGIYLAWSDGNTIAGNEITENIEDYQDTAAIWIADSDNNNISGNNIIDNKNYGIYLGGNSLNNTIIGNKINSNRYMGIWLVGGPCYNKISGNTLLNNSIRFWNSNNNTINGNTITNNIPHYQYPRVSIGGSSRNDIFDNTFLNSSMYIYDSNKNNIYQNSFFNGGLFVKSPYNNSYSNNSVNGKPIVFIVGKSNVIIDNISAGQIIVINCNNITVRNQEIFNTFKGISLHCTNNSLISGNTVINDIEGISLELSINNTISDNTILKNHRGIGFLVSDNNTINDNIITNNGGSTHRNEGIYLALSSYNTITNNIMTNNSISIEVRDSDNTTIADNYIKNNKNGLKLYISRDNIITNNEITSNIEDGVNLDWSSNNTISYNNISNNDYGINLSDSDDNTIIKNNFINNKQKAFFRDCKNVWRKNYWNRPRFLPKLIFGMRMVETRLGFSITIPQLDFDWRPAQEPYDI